MELSPTRGQLEMADDLATILAQQQQALSSLGGGYNPNQGNSQLAQILAQQGLPDVVRQSILNNPSYAEGEISPTSNMIQQGQDIGRQEKLNGTIGGPGGVGVMPWWDRLMMYNFAMQGQPQYARPEQSLNGIPLDLGTSGGL